MMASISVEPQWWEIHILTSMTLQEQTGDSAGSQWGEPLCSPLGTVVVAFSGVRPNVEMSMSHPLGCLGTARGQWWHSMGQAPVLGGAGPDLWWPYRDKKGTAVAPLRNPLGITKGQW